MKMLNLLQPATALRSNLNDHTPRSLNLAWKNGAHQRRWRNYMHGHCINFSSRDT